MSEGIFITNEKELNPTVDKIKGCYKGRMHFLKFIVRTVMKNNAFGLCPSSTVSKKNNISETESVSVLR
jgi:hypothetical protein